MIGFLQKVITFIIDLTDKELKRYMSIFLGCLILILFFGTYRYYKVSSSLKKQIKKVNMTRKDIKNLLSKYGQIKKQKSTVDALLSQDKIFKIFRYFDETTKKLDISHLVTKDPDVIETEPKEGYTEIILTANFARINTKQLAELLNELEQKKRIYIKKLDITKAKNSNTLSFVIVIATLQSQIETGEMTG